VAWSSTVAVRPGQSRLLDFNGELVLVNAPSGITTIDDGPPSEERLLSRRRVEVRPANDSRALLFDEAGLLYRWSPGAQPEQVWDTSTPPNSLEAIALSDKLLLVQHPIAKNADGWITELINPEVGVVWKRSGDLRGALPWNDSVLVIPAQRHSVVRLSVAEGTPVWECSLEDQVATIIAVVAETLWLRTYEGELIAVEVESGAVRTRLRVPLAAVPEGVVDERGWLHLCTGPSYTILDLTADGAVISSEILPVGDDAPSLVFGSAAIPITDGRLLFFDRNGSIYTTRTGAVQPPTLLWRSPAPLLDCQVARETVFILDREGRLSALRP
jgi:hypothetical protein